ncbi:hypothetical protein Agabi119p4_9531 [Agaricus bisporus var. burnettii]|uniref:SET domain-containing protein n=1 Tax=Agaricus bisporus var. burnettii TaxID=192524 RepID=A0A8H7C4R8_AGABI|nr:hypothetical protein Agabi119p4_9531 [Agaricus bisporus var. burnettii]
MANFAELKAARDRRKVQSSFTDNLNSLEDANPSFPSEQPRKTENEVDLSIYHSLPADLEVRWTETRGRGIWSREKRRRGEIIFTEVQQSAALSTGLLATHCSACFVEASGVPLKRCPTCRIIHYCDSECQSRDWTLHKRECTALQKWATSVPSPSPETSEDKKQGKVIPSDAIRALGRMLWRKQKKGLSGDWAKQVDTMQSHRARLSSNEKSSQLHTHMVHALVRYLGLESLDELSSYGIDSIAGLVDLVSRFTTNAFTVASPTLTPIGVSISPIIALFNHSCAPNAVPVFPRAPHNAKANEPMASVITLRDIPANEEVVISYIDTTLTKRERQKALKETYYFTCNCSLCEKPRDGAYVDSRESLYCPKNCGGLCWLPTEDDPLARCAKCGTVVKESDAILDVIRIGFVALKKVNKVQISDPQKAIQLTTNLIRILASARVCPFTQPLLALSRLHTTLLISNYRSPFDPNVAEISSSEIQEQRQTNQEDISALSEKQNQLDETIQSAKRTTMGLNRLLPFGHPIRALALTELGKLLIVDEPDPKHLKEKSDISSVVPSGSSSLPQLAGTAKYPPSGPQRLKLAYETLVSARRELIVGFGGGKNEGGQVGMEVRKILVEIEKELGVWKEGIRGAIADLPKTTGK